MNAPDVAALQKFISLHHLNYTDGIIIFDAAVGFFKGSTLHCINSQIQIITLPNSMVIYIFEFLKEEHTMTEMYSTAYYHFISSDPGSLKIIDGNGDNPYAVSITVL